MNPLISPAELKALQPPPLLLDLRFDLLDPAAGRQAYLAGHLDGAHYLHLDEDCCAPKTGLNGRHPLPPREAFAARLRERGWTYDRPVVCMDGGNSMFAARAWWMLRWLGHDRVAVLDGGVAAWVADGGALTTAPPAATPSADFPLREPLVALTDKAQLRAQLGRVPLVDARAAERFRGEVEPLDRQAGHIPGSRNRPFADNLGPDGRFKPLAQLRGEWAPLRPTAQSVHSCGSGVSACHNQLALAAAGLPSGVLYGGSWSEWSADASLPMART